MIETLKNVNIDKIKPYEKNYQSHDLNREHIKNSIEDFNFDVPIVVDPDYVIVKGHGRYEALKELNHKTVPLVVVNHSLDTKEKAAAARIADNESSRAAQIDNNILKGELLDIGDFFDMSDYGLMDIMGEDEEIETTGDDEVPEAVPAITVKGDLYELGEHRLLCGDSTMIDDVEKLMDGEKADMVFTDPPYNVAFKGQELSNTTKNGKKILNYKSANTKHNKIHNDNMADSDFYNFMHSVIGNIKTLSPKSWYFSFCDLNLDELLNPLKDNGFQWKSILIWVKNQATLSGKDYKSRYEPIIYGCDSNSFYGERYKQEDVLEFQRTLKNDIHPTMKPIKLIEYLINNSSKKGEIVIDLFLGSGSTLIACEKTNRKCYGMELDEKYCDVIVKRYVDFCKKNNKKYTVKRNGAICSDFE